METESRQRSDFVGESSFGTVRENKVECQKKDCSETQYIDIGK